MDEQQRGRDETPEERADRNFSDILQELRVVLTGTQLISGFLLAVAFQSRFEDLGEQEIQHYLVLVVLAAVATLLGLTPVTLHRLHFAKRLKAQIVRRANGLLIATLAVVSVLVVGVTAFIFEVVVSPRPASGRRTGPRRPCCCCGSSRCSRAGEPRRSTRPTDGRPRVAPRYRGACPVPSPVRAWRPRH